MPRLEAALALAGRGWSVIPLIPGEKRPLLDWKPYQAKPATAEQIRAWWGEHPEANLGIVTGAVSGLVVLDLDGPAGLKSIKGKHLPPTLSCKTPRGWHYYFRHPGGEVSNRTALLPGVDVRGDGGYVVAPPSANAEGVPYAWAEGLADLEPAPLPDWLAEAFRAPSAPIARTGENWLQGAPEGRRNDTAARLCGRWISAGLPAREAEELLVLWNQRNRPPLPEEEVRRVARSIAEREEAKKKVPEPMPSFALPVGILLSQVDKPVSYLASPLLERGTIGFIGGEPKLGKSWLALQIALAVSTGTPVLGSFPVINRERVLFIEEEDSADLLRRRIRLLCAGHGIPMPEDAYFRLAVRTGFQVDNPRWFTTLEHELREFRPALVIVDVLNKVHGADENEQTEMTRIMGLFEKARREFGCGFLIVHHFRKQGGEGASRGNQRLRGSSVLGGWSECSFYLSPMGNGALRVEHESKNGSQEAFAFRLDDTKDTAGKILAVRLAHQGAAAVLQQSDKLNETLEAVEAAYAEGGADFCTPKALAIRLDVVENTARAYLRCLEEAKKVRRQEIRPEGRKATAYVPADVSAEHPPKAPDLLSPAMAGDTSAQNDDFELNQQPLFGKETRYE